LKPTLPPSWSYALLRCSVSKIWKCASGKIIGLDVPFDEGQYTDFVPIIIDDGAIYDPDASNIYTSV
jgi:hypothetical protein